MLTTVQEINWETGDLEEKELVGPGEVEIR